MHLVAAGFSDTRCYQVMSMPSIYWGELSYVWLCGELGQGKPNNKGYEKNRNQ